MIDVHSHILPGLDDGASDRQVAMQMAVLAVDDGITDIIATPHTHNELYLNDPETIRAAVTHFQEQLDEAQIPLRVHPGSEVHIHVDLAKNLRHGHLQTLDGFGRYVLLEFPVLNLPLHVTDLLLELLEMGYTPIIAHPERNVVIRREPERLAEWIELGVMAQLTAGSLLGQLGKQARTFAAFLVQKSLVHVIASDAHNTSRRRPQLSEAYRELGRLTDGEAVPLFHQNAAAILQGQPGIVRAPFTEFRKQKFRWF